MPDVVTMDEAGMPGFDVGIWIGLLAPAGTPADIVIKLSVAAHEALKTDAVKNAMKAQGIGALGSTPQEFSDFIRKDIEKWTLVLSTAGLFPHAVTEVISNAGHYPMDEVPVHLATRMEAFMANAR